MAVHHGDCGQDVFCGEGANGPAGVAVGFDSGFGNGNDADAAFGEVAGAIEVDDVDNAADVAMKGHSKTSI